MKNDPEEERFVIEEYEDGFTEFHDTKNSPHGFLHPNDTFITINKDGDVFMQSIKKSTFHNKDSDLMLEADSESGDITFKTKGKLDSIIDKDVIRTYKAKQALVHQPCYPLQDDLVVLRCIRIARAIHYKTT